MSRVRLYTIISKYYK